MEVTVSRRIAALLLVLASSAATASGGGPAAAVAPTAGARATGAGSDVPSGSGGRSPGRARQAAARAEGRSAFRSRISLPACGVSIAAHRGQVGPVSAYDENTLGAARRGLTSGGASLTEYDVRAADGRHHPWFALHDRMLNRTTDGRGPIDSVGAGYVGSVRTRDGSRVPRLTDMLSLVARRHGRGAQNEIKPNPRSENGSYSRDDIDHLLRLVAGAHMWHRTYVTSFSPAVLRQVASSGIVDKHGVLPLGLIRGRHFGPRRLAEVATYVTTLNIPMAALTPRLVRAAHARGLLVSVRGVEDAADVRRALDVTHGVVGRRHVDNLVSDTVGPVVAACSAIAPYRPAS